MAKPKDNFLSLDCRTCFFCEGESNAKRKCRSKLRTEIDSIDQEYNKLSEKIGLEPLSRNSEDQYCTHYKSYKALAIWYLFLEFFLVFGSGAIVFSLLRYGVIYGNPISVILCGLGVMGAFALWGFFIQELILKILNIRDRIKVEHKRSRKRAIRGADNLVAQRYQECEASLDRSSPDVRWSYAARYGIYEDGKLLRGGYDTPEEAQAAIRALRRKRESHYG